MTPAIEPLNDPANKIILRQTNIDSGADGSEGKIEPYPLDDPDNRVSDPA